MRATHIFAIPPESELRNCSGGLVSIQYCYRAKTRDYGKNKDVFDLSLLKSLNQDGLYLVKSTTAIRSTPGNDTCTAVPGDIQQICCDTKPLSGLHVPSPEFTFSVTITNPVTVRPVTFLRNNTEYRYLQTVAALGELTGPAQGSMFTVNEANSRIITNRSLILLRFIIGMTFHEVVVIHNS